MTTIAFDTLKFVERLKAAGVPDSQAKAFAEAQRDAFAEATDSALATRADILDIKSELRLLKWMVGLSLALSAGVLSLLARLTLALPH